MVVGIDQLQQLAFKHLQGRLEGDGQSVEDKGQHLQQLRPQQSISCDRTNKASPQQPYHNIYMTAYSATISFFLSLPGFLGQREMRDKKVWNSMFLLVTYLH